MLKYVFYWGWYLPSNGTIADAVFHDLVLNFRGQTFSSHAFTIKCTGSGCPRQICLDSRGSRSRVALVILLSYLSHVLFLEGVTAYANNGRAVVSQKNICKSLWSVSEYPVSSDCFNRFLRPRSRHFFACPHIRNNIKLFHIYSMQPLNWHTVSAALGHVGDGRYSQNNRKQLHHRDCSETSMWVFQVLEKKT